MPRPRTPTEELEDAEEDAAERGASEDEVAEVDEASERAVADVAS